MNIKNLQLMKIIKILWDIVTAALFVCLIIIGISLVSVIYIVIWFFYRIHRYLQKTPYIRKKNKNLQTPIITMHNDATKKQLFCSG